MNASGSAAAAVRITGQERGAAGQDEAGRGVAEAEPGGLAERFRGIVLAALGESGQGPHEHGGVLARRVVAPSTSQASDFLDQVRRRPRRATPESG